MRLLVLTQKVDQNDDILGFFHGWLIEFAKHVEEIIVICLYEGKHNLPENVSVHSLGKEQGMSRLTYLARFYRYIWKFRRNYDAVFVHMNQEYLLLGGVLWWLLRRKMFLWRNHPKGTLLTDIASFFPRKIFYTSPFSYTARFKEKGILMPAGIDTEKFRRDNVVLRKKASILSLGRISPIKHIDVIISALVALDQQGVDFQANIIGNAPKRDESYVEQLKKQASVVSSKVLFHPGVLSGKASQTYNKHEIFINATSSGSFDKTILEAMACELLVITSNKSFEGILPPPFLFREEDAVSLSESLIKALVLTDEEKRQYGRMFRDYVVKHHDVRILLKEAVVYIGNDYVRH